MRALTTSAGILADAQLAKALGREVRHLRNSVPPETDDICIGWGDKANTEQIKRHARKNDLPYWRLEDGFVGYLGHPAHDKRRLSVIIDKLGIYYNAHHPSDLETHIANRAIAGLVKDHGRISRLLERFRLFNVSKYNHLLGNVSNDLDSSVNPIFSQPYILVVDQTQGDYSIDLGCASQASFNVMLRAALDDHPDLPIIIKTHPDVLLGLKEGCVNLSAINIAESDIKRIHFSGDAILPTALYKHCKAAYVVTSQLGFEALIHNVPVVTFGCPFYAAWGLTDDRTEIAYAIRERRNVSPSLKELAAAVFLDYLTWLDPNRRTRTSPETVFDLLEAKAQIAHPLSPSSLWAPKFSLWKQAFVKNFVPSGVKLNHFMLRKNKTSGVLLWGKAKAKRCKGPIWRMEDGFLRSVGLGSDLNLPSSLVLDGEGIYYDATGPSALESWLSASELSPEGHKRAEALRQRIIKARISKYNIGTTAAIMVSNKAEGKRKILVPGQVESDASIQFGSPQIKTNRGLLEAVRERHPGAYIVYKPHPDVVAGNREGSVEDEAGLADEVVLDADILDCLDAVDEIHTLTSLTGFEALLRGKKVTCYGLPFYAGWGLTEDRYRTIRRGRHLRLSHLVYGALIAYPTYFDWRYQNATSPEGILDAMEEMKASQSSTRVQESRVLRSFKKFYFLLRSKLR